MISAKEANEMANEKIQKKLKRWQNKINKWIRIRVKQGYFDLNLSYHYIPDSVCDSLIDYYKKLGYKAHLNIDRYAIHYNDEYQVIISWKDKEVADE